MSKPERWVAIPAEDVLVVYGDERPGPEWIEVPASLVRVLHTAAGSECAVSAAGFAQHLSR